MSCVFRNASTSLLLLLLLGTKGLAEPPSTALTEGLRNHTPTVHAFLDARIVVSPGKVIESGTLVIRDGKIEACGTNVEIPVDARTWNLKGKTIYPGLIDAYAETTLPADAVRRGSPYWNPLISPQLNLADHYKADPKVNEKLRSQGITSRLLSPAAGIIKGTSAIVSTLDEPSALAILKPHVAQHIHLYVSRAPRRDHYPNSPMGAVSLGRQAMYDADWYRSAWNVYWANPKVARPERNDALEVLQHLPGGRQLVIIDADSELYYFRAEEFSKEFSLRTIVRGSGREYRRLKEITATGRPIIVPVAFPKPPNVTTAEAVLNAQLEDMLHWDIAPENPGRLEKAGVKIAFTTFGLAEPKEFIPALRKAVVRGLSVDGALRALTTTPAELYGVQESVGTLELGKLADFLITDGDLFSEKTRILETWTNGQRHEITKRPLYDIRGEWELKLSGQAKVGKVYVSMEGTESNLKGKIGTSPPANDEAKKQEPKKEETGKKKDVKEKEKSDEEKSSTVKLDHIALQDSRFGFAFDAEAYGQKGVGHLTALVMRDEKEQLIWVGEIVWPNEMRSSVVGQRVVTSDDKKNSDAKINENADSAKKKHDASASFAVNYPFGSFGRSTPPAAPKLLAIRNAKIWTCGPQGILENGTLVIGDGKILAVGSEKDVDIPEGATVLDAKGKHLAPGIIDCHSHEATDGGINETGRAITCQVRVGDFIDSNDVNIYRQLAGGVTCIHILHGSANAIGGQNQVIKLRWGEMFQQLKMPEAPPTVKFALGENPKQSNWGDGGHRRYPQTRMGVEQIIRDEFQAAKEYDERWQRWVKERDGLPPRRDLELDCIVEVLKAQRWIHCHSYRQDEILAFLRLMEEYKVRVGCLQHILEGYKVADAIAKHGAGGSAFSDWWAYKFEVFDAIPYNGAVMHNAGIVVSFNSDDRELARHLNQEAAKAVRYGGVPPQEALKFVTLNPAKQLLIDQYTGSLETGKQADFVLWSGSPLSNFSRPEQTWVDGKKYFDLEEDKKSREEIRRMHNTLTQKILASGEPMRNIGEDTSTDKDHWARHDEYCHAHPHDARNCNHERKAP